MFFAHSGASSLASCINQIFLNYTFFYFCYNIIIKVDERKLKEIFRLAGRVNGIELTRDKEGKSRGFAVVVYDHPVEAVQAISMFHDQQLNDRRMTVRFDKVPEEEPPRNLNRLPDGLRGIGMGLGQDGTPLWDVRNNLPQSSNEGNTLGLGNLATSMSMQQPAAAAGTGAALQAALATIMGMAGAANPSNIGMGAGMETGLLGSGMGNGGSGMSMGIERSGRDLDRSMGSLNSSLDLGRGMGGMDMSMGAMDRGIGGMDRGMGLLDRGMGGIDRGMGGIDRGMGGMDRGMSSMDRGMGGMDRGMRGMGGMDHSMSGMDRGMGGMDRGMDRGMGGMERSSRGMDRGMSMSGGKKSDKIVVKNLPMEITWQVLKDRFGHAGDIKFAEIRESGVGVIR